MDVFFPPEAQADFPVAMQVGCNRVGGAVPCPVQLHCVRQRRTVLSLWVSLHNFHKASEGGSVTLDGLTDMLSPL